MSFRTRLKNFFYPPKGSSRWLFVLPIGVVILLGLSLLAGGAYAWNYVDSPHFCGYTCHTMPPQNITYLNSPHANVNCTECHIGRAFIGEQFARKSQDVGEVIATIFHTYKFPIIAEKSRPARQTCEKCHKPEAFIADSLHVIPEFAPDENNSRSDTYLILQTGGGAKSEGLGKGIHWHIVNKVQYYPTDKEAQNIPYIVVTNDDGTTTSYLDIESNFDPASIKPENLKTVDCMTCHNRVAHNFQPPEESVDIALSRGLIAVDIPFIRERGVQVLMAKYVSRDKAVEAISSLENYYRDNQPEYYASNSGKVQAAVAELQAIWDRTVFIDQDVDWTTHPNNIGHIDSPGCFRCHDGKHLNSQNQSVRLECNICHSIPVISKANDLVTNIQISNGPEPESHRNANWITLHRSAVDTTCENCHTTADMGGVSDTSFCSNSGCHGTKFTYAGFDAPKLREALQGQLPTPMPTAVPTETTAETPTAIEGKLTFDANIAPVFKARCTMCHGGGSPYAGLSLETYALAMQGTKDGPVIIPGDSADSLIVKVQSGKHMANLSAEELNLLIQWIDAGAPEN